MIASDCSRSHMIQVAVIMAVVSTTLPVLASDYCAIRLTIRDVEGRSVDDVPVTLKEKDGADLLKTHSRRGIAEFCDVGLGRFDIEIGTQSRCGDLVLKAVRTVLSQTTNLHAIYNLCEHDRWPSPNCLVLIRARDSRGAPIAGLAIESDVMRPGQRTDRLGRVATVLARKERAKFKVAHPSYEATSFEIGCPAEPEEIEKTVILQEVGRR